MTMIELDVIDDDKYNNKYIYDIKDNDTSIGTVVINKK